jgi:glycerophosphoryl diester phosphodiesterase
MRPLLLGHRGARASLHIPENTLASFELCLQHGCDGFEFDVRKSADGAAVICHDPAIRGLEIGSTPASALALPSLEEVLQQFSSRAFLDIELKVVGLETHLTRALRRFPPKKGYVVSSFLPEVLGAVHHLDASIPLGFLYEKFGDVCMESGATRPATSDDESVPLAFPVQWLIPRVDLVDRELIERTHASGRKVTVWTVNDADKMLQLAAWGVDAIISDQTEMLVQSVC